MNVVMTGAGRFVEVQGTAEGMAFTRGELDTLLGLAEDGHQGADRPAGGRAGRAAAAAVSGRRAAPLRLVLASANPDKVKEIVAVLVGGARRRAAAPARRRCPRSSRTPTRCVGQRPPEGARAGRRRPGMAAVADDTGLEVDALGGAPGVYSARYAGEDATYADNVAKLLRELGGAAPTAAASGGPASRRWRWSAFPDGSEVVGRGRARRGPSRPSAAGTQRLRLRPRVRARRRRRAHLRRDARRRRRTPSRTVAVPSGRWRGAGWRERGRRRPALTRQPLRGAPPASSRYSSSGKAW